MKKAALILLICVYSFATMGFSIKQFYCCGKLKSVSVSLSSNEKTKCSKGDNKDGCCKTKYQYFKLNDTHLPTAHVASPISFHTDLCLSYISLQPFVMVAKDEDVINGSHAPPLHAGVPIYISNCVFRI